MGRDHISEGQEGSITGLYNCKKNERQCSGTQHDWETWRFSSLYPQRQISHTFLLSRCCLLSLSVRYPPVTSAWATKTIISNSTYMGVVSTLKAPCLLAFLKQTKKQGPSSQGPSEGDSEYQKEFGKTFWIDKGWSKLKPLCFKKWFGVLYSDYFSSSDSRKSYALQILSPYGKAPLSSLVSRSVYSSPNPQIFFWAKTQRLWTAASLFVKRVLPGTYRKSKRWSMSQT